MSKFLENILQSIRTIAGTTDEKILKLENLLAMTPHKERRARGKIETLLEEFRGLRDGGVRYRIWIGRKPDKPSMTILSTRSLRGNPVVKINETLYRVCRIKRFDAYIKILQPISCTTIEEKGVDENGDKKKDN